MYLEIVSPEATLFKSEVDSVIMPGADGEFQMLNNHAAVVSTLTDGVIKIQVNKQVEIDLEELNPKVTPSNGDKRSLTITINSGTVEMNNNKAIILVD
ncbi:MAG: F0F1 ATP synthase subunit epsilon [Bacteroidota bacterium]